MAGFIVRQINDFHIGHWIASKFIWLFSLVIMLKVFNLPLWTYLVSIPLMILIVLIAGKVMRRVGLWDEFISENMKGIRNENKS